MVAGSPVPYQNDPMVACYIDSSYPAMLFFAYKYAYSLEDAILASANAGGKRVFRFHAQVYSSLRISTFVVH